MQSEMFEYPNVPLWSWQHRFFSALLGEGKYPCGRCCRDCLDETPCISCSICDRWFHFECSNLSAKDFNSIDYYFCSPACEICLLPFTEVTTSILIKEGILCDRGVTKNTSKKKKKEIKKKRTENKTFSIITKCKNRPLSRNWLRVPWYQWSE